MKLNVNRYLINLVILVMKKMYELIKVLNFEIEYK